MRQFLGWLLKAVVAGILALAAASLFCTVYYNPGIHVTNETGVTDYRWQKNSFQCGMTEGIAWNRTDKNGFFNDGSSPDINMDILLMGSSHMEGTQVFAKHSTSQLLSKYTGYSVYNIGTAGHNLLTCVDNLDTALSLMQPTKYVIIETDSIAFPKQAIEQCLSGNLPEIPSYDRGLLFQLQRISYFKLLYAQLKSWNGTEIEAHDNTVGGKTEALGVLSADASIKLAQKIKSSCEKHGVQAIVFYHPGLFLDSDGSAKTASDAESKLALQAACKANDIFFIDMTNDFMEMFDNTCKLPYGFLNTSVGQGHLNKYGHDVIAKRLATEISDGLHRQEGAAQ